jgi:hypothetical protein
MPQRSKIQSILLTLIVFIGLTPFIYFVSGELGAAEASQNNTEMSIPSDPLDRYIENYSFGVGEELEFEVKYGFISAGTATMSIERLIEYENRPCYLITSIARSNSFFSTFYKVEDRVETIVDAMGLYSWRFEKNLNEGSYHAQRLVVFDQRNQKVYYKEDTTEAPLFVQDALSVFYFVRTQPLEVGKSILVDHYNDGNLFSLEVKVLEKEKVTVSAGTFECFVVEPLLKSVGVFKHEGQLKVWLTDDRLRLPVLMKSKVLVGSISAELTNYKLGEIEVY